MSNYDFKQLTSAVSHSDIKAYRNDGYQLSDKIAPAYHFVPIISFMFGVMGYLPARIVEGVTGSGFYLILIIVVFALVGFLEGWYLCVTIPKRAWIRLVRLARFTHANHFGYAPEAAGPTNDGLLFSQPNTFEVFDNIYQENKNGRAFEFGNASVIKANVITPIKAYNWGFIHLRLDRSVPHIVLDSKSNNHLLTRTNLPKSFHKSQILGLEGDFERHFTVYTSKDYKHDTLHILTPDLIELFIDRLSQYDIEFVGTSLYIYKNKWFDLDQQETIEDILAITDEIGAAIKKRTKRRANDLVLTDEHGKLK